MKMLTLYLFCQLFFGINAWAQNDPSVPTTTTGGGGGVKSVKKDTTESLLIDEMLLTTNLKDRWISCGGDNIDKDLSIIAANIMASAIAHNKGPQPNCEECLKKINRFECMGKNGGFDQLKTFANSTKLITYFKLTMTRKQARNLRDSLQFIISSNENKN